MPATDPTITIERFSEVHIDGITSLYNDPAVARQVLQMPFQTSEVWRKRIAPDNERLLQLVAVHQGVVIGNCGLEQFSRIRRSHCGNIGMGVAVAWQGKGVGSKLLAAALDIADNWMNLQRVELTVYADNEAAIGLYRKFGFETEGLLRDYAVRDGGLVDALSMARLRRTRSAS
ncbi:GNAT family N-acetyltransferase [Pseudomonas fluorescens]|uniref:L-amino acid N-acetyltransferase AaaT n=1 Tax=Pseudomonas fluorescens TaxID=294 RepID=A0A5E7FQA6_PSEFL|nr:GNAT family N-acetyltransferase [Pseudomonas fluorescens]VVO41691.1 L-amino acid N-acetyltransferase AaaT [Pseudomonas fluorescens]